MNKALLLPLSLSVSLFANGSLEIYTNKSFLSQNFVAPKEVSFKVPSYVNSGDIFYTLDEGCSLKSESLLDATTLDTSSQQIKELNIQRDDAIAKQQALLSKKELYSTLEVGSERDFAKIEKAAAFVEKKVLEIENSYNSLENIIVDIDEKLKELEEEPKVEYKTLNLSFTCTPNATAKISYPFSDLSFESYYDIFANTAQNTLNLVEKIALTQSSFEDLKDIDLHIYSKSFDKDLNPQIFYPHYLYKQKAVVYDERPMAMAKSANIQMEEAQIRTIKRESLDTLYSYTIKNISLAKNQMEKITLSDDKFDAKITNFIDGYGSNKAYLKAEFIPLKNYISKKANLFVNALPLGDIKIANLSENIKANLFLGENQFIDVKKELAKTKDESGFFSGKSSIQQWKYSITNSANKSLHVEFVTKTPVSKDGDIKVKTIATPEFTSQSAEGKTTWEFDLGSKEAKEILFGYEVKRDN